MDRDEAIEPATSRIKQELSKCEPFFGGGTESGVLTTVVVVDLDEDTVILLQIKARGSDVDVYESIDSTAARNERESSELDDFFWEGTEW